VEDVEKLLPLLFPYATAKIAEVKEKGIDFVHYTTAESAVKIIQNKSVWMRNSRLMNDYREIEHGVDCIEMALEKGEGAVFLRALDAAHPGISEKVIRAFLGWKSELERNTYVACFSEHFDSENSTGRLSMWRAYGGRAGVALVFDRQAMLSESNALNAYSSPVMYEGYEGISKEFGEVARLLDENMTLLKRFPAEVIEGMVFWMLRVGCLFAKHDGFKEEREWRVVANPGIERSDRLSSSIQTIGGIPQRVLSIPLSDVPEEGLTGLELSKLLKRVIIGPCLNPQVVEEAIRDTLLSVGELSGSLEIVQSHIPLRIGS
jgi:hypothetical protein